MLFKFQVSSGILSIETIVTVDRWHIISIPFRAMLFSVPRNAPCSLFYAIGERENWSAPLWTR